MKKTILPGSSKKQQNTRVTRHRRYARVLFRKTKRTHALENKIIMLMRQPLLGAVCGYNEEFSVCKKIDADYGARATHAWDVSLYI